MDPEFGNPSLPGLVAGIPTLLAAQGPLDGIVPLVLGTIALLVVSFLASLTEAAYMSLSRMRAETLAEEGATNAERLAGRLRLDFARPLATLVIFNNIANSGGPLLAGAAAQHYAEVQGWNPATVVGVYGAILVVLVILFGEILPKTIGEHHPEPVARTAAWPLQVIKIALTPLTAIIGRLQRPFARIGGHQTSEEEIGRLAELGQEQGAIEKHEGEMIGRVLKLDEITAGDIMTPRVDMTMLSADAKLADVKEELGNLKRSLVPLFRKNRDDVVAVLDRMDALLLLARGKGDMLLNDPLITVKPYFVPHTMPANRLLVQLQRRTDHLAVVVGEYGETVGLVTLEDVIEEIVGEIYDENDIGVGTGVQRVSRDVVVALGASEVKDVNDSLGTEIPNHRTVAGLLLDELGDIPSQGATHAAFGVTFEIVERSERAIVKVRIRRDRPPIEDGESPSASVNEDA
ncbi:MAG: hemolysin family protein [Planctomycetes bacterium]|nr:hemolysin family protein [Planctomycetota bacterium]